MGLITFGLSKIEDNDLKHATITMAALTIMLVIISLTTDKLLIPIGKQWELAAKGGAVVLSIIGIMSLVVLGLSKIKKDNLREGVIALAAITIIFGGITLITDKYLIPIGKQWVNAAKGETVILGIIAGMGAIIVAVNRYLKENNIRKSIISLGVMTALLAAVSIITQKYLIPIGRKGKNALKGGVLVESIIAGMSLIVIGVTKLISKISTSELIKGGLVIAGIGGLLWILTKALTPYIKLSILAANNKMNILVGGLMIAGILTAWGLLMAGVGALVSNPVVPVVMAVGGATIAGISLIIFGVTKALTPYVALSKLLVKEKQYVISGGKLVTKVLSEFKDIIVGVGALTSFKDGFNMAIGTAAIADISLVMVGLSKALIPFINTMNMIHKYNITTSTVKQFKDIIIGQRTGLYETLKEVIDKLNEVGILSLMKAKFIAGGLKPIFDTIGKFFEIIKNACNMNYVSEWDKDGKPIAYKSITMPMLK
jgi:membrane protein